MYPLDGTLPEADRMRAIVLVHALRCGQGASFRRIVDALADAGIRVSIGTAHGWTVRYECDRCADDVTQLTIPGGVGA